jgi:hypothetical protein
LQQRARRAYHPLMAYDPSTLRAIAANPTAYPGSPPNPVDRGGPPAPPAPGGAPGAEPAKSEPEQLAELAAKAKEALAAARAAFDDLSAFAEMAETVDPKSEKTIAKAAEMLTTLDEECEALCEGLEAAAGEHAKMVSGDED